MLIGLVLTLVTHLVVPVALAWSLWRGSHKSKTSWLAAALGSGAYVLYICFAGAGWHLGYWFRLAVPLLFLVALLASFQRAWRAGLPWWRRPGSVGGWASLATYAILVVLFGWSTVAAAGGLSYGDERAARLAFPLEGGTWHVYHGGNSPTLNYHNVDRAQRYALDVVRLNRLGTRASGFFPSDPERYYAFGAGVTSPCTGEVVDAADGMADHRGTGTDRERPAGNHVVVRCREQDPKVDVALAHMMEGSVVVGEGEEVEEGQPLGRVGNSGNTSEPHLHVHAVRTGSGSVLKGEGVPMTFDGRFLVRGSLIFGG